MNAMAALTQSETTPIKYESPYAPRPISQIPTLKRRYPEGFDKVDEGDEKRQRVEVDTSDDIDLDALIAQASSAAVATAGAASNPGNTQDSGGNGYGSMFPYDTEYLSDPQVYMRLSSSPILENLSTQILSLMVHGTYEETLGIFTNPQSDKGQQYQTLRSLLDQTKKMYNTAGQKSNFLQIDKAYTNNEKYQSIIWSTNLAILATAIFGGTESDWEAVHTAFLEILVPKPEDLNREACETYLSFATQMILSSFAAEEQQISREESLDHFFPPELDKRLLARHPEQGLTAIESELVQNSMERRKLLEEESNELEILAKLMQKYTWDDFLTSFFNYVKNTHQDKIPEYKTPPNLIASRTGPTHTSHYDDQIPEFDMDALVNGAVDRALQMQSVVNTPMSTHAAQQASLYGEQYASGTPAVPSQSQPTAKLYEQARQQAASKNSSNNRRGSGGLSARRPWSNEEENALMAGLDQVKGPHWSQILGLYGQQGSISHVLEHRNQVQLKDKARNLKLFFLKSGIEVPYYLSSVTGELKTRAPSQAARKEAEERARLTSDESVNRANGILMLANGFQQSTSNNGLPHASDNNGIPSIVDSIESPHVADNRGISLSADHNSRSQSQEEMHVTETAQANGFNEGLAAALKESIRLEQSIE